MPASKMVFVLGARRKKCVFFQTLLEMACFQIDFGKMMDDDGAKSGNFNPKVPHSLKSRM